jgi:hypothetical protein
MRIVDTDKRATDGRGQTIEGHKVREATDGARRAVRFTRALALGGLAVAAMGGCGDDDEPTKKPDADTIIAVDGPLAPPDLPRHA